MKDRGRPPVLREDERDRAREMCLTHPPLPTYLCAHDVRDQHDSGGNSQHSLITSAIVTAVRLTAQSTGSSEGDFDL